MINKQSWQEEFDNIGLVEDTLKAKLIKEVEGLKLSKIAEDNYYKIGFNQAINDVLEILKK
jgi:hypothetical protein